jgi:hypothetical protein
MSAASVWKFPIDPFDTVSVPMPQGAEVLTAAMQGEVLCIWALVNPDARLINHKFAIAGTGHTRHDLEFATYIATVQMLGGAMVFHVFDLEEDEA